MDAYARALGEDPANEATQSQLERVALAAGDAQKLAQIYEQQVEKVTDPQVASLLHVKAAQIRENMLGDVHAAIGHYRQVLDHDAHHLEAATALERLYLQTEQFEALASIYLAKSKMLTELDDQKQHLYRGAQFYEDLLEQPLRAVDVYKEVLELDAEDLHSLDKLSELYLKLGRWEDLLSAYAKKADIVSEPEAKKAIYSEIGAVYERELNDSARAIDTYQRILEVDPDDRTAIGRLDTLYLATETGLS